MISIRMINECIDYCYTCFLLSGSYTFLYLKGIRHIEY